MDCFAVAIYIIIRRRRQKGCFYCVQQQQNEHPNKINGKRSRHEISDKYSENKPVIKKQKVNKEDDHNSIEDDMKVWINDDETQWLDLSDYDQYCLHSEDIPFIYIKGEFRGNYYAKREYFPQDYNKNYWSMNEWEEDYKSFMKNTEIAENKEERDVVFYPEDLREFWEGEDAWNEKSERFRRKFDCSFVCRVCSDTIQQDFEQWKETRREETETIIEQILRRIVDNNCTRVIAKILSEFITDSDIMYT